MTTPNDSITATRDLAAYQDARVSQEILHTAHTIAIVGL